MRIKPEEMPSANRQLYNLIIKETDGNVSAFSKIIGVKQQMIDMLLKPDKKTGEYRKIFPSVRKAVAEHYNISESWVYSQAEENALTEIDNSNLDIINKLINQIGELTEANNRNSKSLERLIDIMAKND